MKKIIYTITFFCSFALTGQSQTFVFDSTGHISVFNSGSSIFLGNLAGENDDVSSNFNVFIGTSAGRKNISGFNNVGLGTLSFANNMIGHRNVAIGRRALEHIDDGDQNTAVGEAAMLGTTLGDYNTAIGNSAGFSSMGSNNVYLGFNAGYDNEGSFNVLLGNSAGYNETQSNRLYIENSNSTDPLIYGKFDDDILAIHGKLGIETKTPLSQLHVHNPDSPLSTIMITPQAFSSGDSSSIFFAEDHDASFGMEWLYDGFDNMMKLSGFANGLEYRNNLVVKRSSPEVGIGTDEINGNLEIYDEDEVRLVMNRKDNTVTGQSKSVIEFQNDGTKLYEIGTWVDDPGLYFLKANGGSTMYMRANGEVGIGTIAPSARVHISDPEPTGAAFKVTKSSFTKMQLWENGGLGIGTSLTTWIPSNGLFVDGNVNIGRANKSGYKVSIDGKMVAEELLVELSGDWPDYVFESSYDLMPLDQVEAAIHANNHLPGIPSASEIDQIGGLHLGEMQRKMMEKIEELTLYVIDLQKQIEVLKSK